jgi:hypothetical protein
MFSVAELDDMLLRLQEAESERAPLLARVLTPVPPPNGAPEKIDLEVLSAFREAHRRVAKVVAELSELNARMRDNCVN